MKNAAKSMLKSIGFNLEREDRESTPNTDQRTEGSDDSGAANIAILGAQRATGHNTEMQIDPPMRVPIRQPETDMSARPLEGKHQQPAPRENPWQSGKTAGPTRRNSAIEGREQAHVGRDAKFADSKDKRIAQLEEYISQLSQNHNAKLGEMHKRVVQNEREKEEYAAKLIEVCKERDQIAEDNVTLRAINIAMRSPHGHYPDDENYIQRFKNLNESMKIWVKNSFKSNQHPQLSDAEDANIVQVLSNHKEFEPLLSMLSSKDSLRPIYSNSACRIILVRHLIALHLCQHIFRPFCFGLDGNSNRLMNNIFQSILTKG
jgi:hypothetical protein